MTTLSKKILVVDDDEFQRKSMKKMLGMLGHDVELAKNAKEALEILEEKEFPLIITDLIMPKMDGMELCKRIREINSMTVIYSFSGYLTKFEPKQLEEIGFDGHLRKPVKLEVLERAIKGAFEKINKRREAHEWNMKIVSNY